MDHKAMLHRLDAAFESFIAFIYGQPIGGRQSPGLAVKLATLLALVGVIAVAAVFTWR
jgi:hypothetical protein